jgi:hypothetical protein
MERIMFVTGNEATHQAHSGNLAFRRPRVVKKFERWTNLEVVPRRQAYRARELGQRVLKVFRGFSIS